MSSSSDLQHRRQFSAPASSISLHPPNQRQQLGPSQTNSGSIGHLLLLLLSLRFFSGSSGSIGLYGSLLKCVLEKMFIATLLSKVELSEKALMTAETPTVSPLRSRFVLPTEVSAACTVLIASPLIPIFSLAFRYLDIPQFSCKVVGT